MPNIHNDLQEKFLRCCIAQKAPVTLFLANGVKLQGVIERYDNFSVLLVRDGHGQMVYKHAISTIMPVHKLDLQSLDVDA